MAALLAQACCSVSELIHHALRSVGAPLHGNLGRGMARLLNRSWNSERPLVFSHVVPTKTLGVRRAREIRTRITRLVDLWDRVQHAGVVGDIKAEGATQESRAASSGEEE